MKSRHLTITSQASIACGSLAFALLYGVVGCYLLRAQFHGVDNWLDALYFTFVTYSTIGYGDIYPLTSTAKLFTMSEMLVGVGSFVAVLSILIGPMIQRRVTGVYRMITHLHHLKEHVILCGVNELTKTLARALSNQKRSCYFLESDAQLSAQLEKEGFFVMAVNPYDEQQLSVCNLNAAYCFVTAYDDDAKNILITMTARALMTQGSSVKLITRVEHAHNADKAKLAGAHEVISPLKISAERVMELVG